MLEMDGWSPEGEEDEPDGFIDLEEWQGYFRYIAETDTRNPEVREYSWCFGAVLVDRDVIDSSLRWWILDKPSGV